MKKYLDDESVRIWIKQKALEHTDFLDAEKIYSNFSEIVSNL